MAGKKISKSISQKAARTRPDWDTYFLDIVDLVSRRSTCLRRAVGAALVRDRRILATGYNGVPFRLAADEQMEILSTQAPSLAFLAKRLTEHSNGKNGGHKVSPARFPRG